MGKGRHIRRGGEGNSVYYSKGESGFCDVITSRDMEYRYISANMIHASMHARKTY